MIQQKIINWKMENRRAIKRKMLDFWVLQAKICSLPLLRVWSSKIAKPLKNYPVPKGFHYRVTRNTTSKNRLKKFSTRRRNTNCQISKTQQKDPLRQILMLKRQGFLCSLNQLRLGTRFSLSVHRISTFRIHRTLKGIQALRLWVLLLGKSGNFCTLTETQSKPMNHFRR